MTKEKFTSSIIEMVVKNSVPLRFFSLPAFQKLNGEMAKQLQVSLDRNSIRSLVIEEANRQRQILKNMITDRLLHLKMDACTRMRTNYFAINIQFLNDDMETIIKTLAVLDTKNEHSSESIKQIVLGVLDSYGIQKWQILTIVTDNASNMISTIEKMNDQEQDGEVEDDSHSTAQSADSALITEHISTDSDIDTCQENEETVSDLDGFCCSMDSISIDLKMHHMRCATHTLQLAICDGLKGRHASNLISRVRNIATRARTPKIDAILKRRAKKGAIIDQATRWGSTYLMIQRILELKPVLQDMADPSLTMSAAHWEQVKDLEELLSHPFKVTKNLQSSTLTPGTFMKEWNMLKLRLTQIGGLIADAIKDSMVNREAVLLNNEILLAVASSLLY